MSALSDALEELLAQHRRIGSPVPGYLRPGLEGEPVRRQVMAVVGHDPPDAAVELFGWHDGIDNDKWKQDHIATGFERLFGDTYFAPLGDAVRHYRERMETDEIVARYEPGGAVQTWRPSWFPLFCLGWDTYAVECDPKRPDRGRIYDPAWDPPTYVGPGPRFRDLQHLIESAIRRFEASGYAWDGTKRFLEERRRVLEPLYEREIAEARA